MTEALDARAMYGQANQVREDGDPLRSLQLIDAAMVAAGPDTALVAEMTAGRSIALRHLHQQTGHKHWIDLALGEMRSAVGMTRRLDTPTAMAMPLYNLAKVELEVGETETAVKTYEEAAPYFEEHLPEEHNRDGVRADFRIHQAAAEALNGDETAVDRIKEGIQALKNSDEEEISKYNYDVWLSGAYMSLARVLKKADPTEAKDYLNQAKEVIDANPALSIRLSQWEKIAELFT